MKTKFEEVVMRLHSRAWARTPPPQGQQHGLFLPLWIHKIVNLFGAFKAAFGILGLPTHPGKKTKFSPPPGICPMKLVLGH